MKNIRLIALVLFLAACGGDDDGPPRFDGTNEEEILDYISRNNLDATRSNSGLYYVIENEGTGDRPTASSNVRVAYKGYFTNGNVFDQSGPDGISFPLTNVIPGWTEGIQYFREGGNGILLVPSQLGYGSRGVNGIPGNTVLIFDVNLIRIN